MCLPCPSLEPYVFFFLDTNNYFENVFTFLVHVFRDWCLDTKIVLNFVRVWVLKQWTQCSRPRCWTCWNRLAGKARGLQSNPQWCRKMSEEVFIITSTCLIVRPEMVVGWYHSHPGFGCWLSGVDINTQQSFEALSERAVAVVVDPIQSVKGKVRMCDCCKALHMYSMSRYDGSWDCVVSVHYCFTTGFFSGCYWCLQTD